MIYLIWAIEYLEDRLFTSMLIDSNSFPSSKHNQALTFVKRDQVLGVLLPELLVLAEVQLGLVAELVAGVAVLGRAAE